MFKFIRDAVGTVTGVMLGKAFSFSKAHIAYDELIAALEAGDHEEIERLMDVGVCIDDWSGGRFVLKNGRLYCGDVEAEDAINRKVKEMIRANEDITPLLNFLDKVSANDSETARQDLYRFLLNSNLAITPDGNFTAYKYVKVYEGEPFIDENGKLVSRNDFVDVHSGKIRNNIGDSPRMDRSGVNPSREVCAGAGLHVGNVDYATMKDYSVIVEVDPVDVVVVPSAESCKVRTCGYTVLSLYKKPLETPVYRPLEDDYEDDIEDDYDADYEDDDDDWDF